MCFCFVPSLFFGGKFGCVPIARKVCAVAEVYATIVALQVITCAV